ncbi:hypothetical protein FQZ97_1177490 [compost metagenome]
MNQVAVLPDGLIIEAVFLHDMNHPLRIRFQAANGALPLLEQQQVATLEQTRGAIRLPDLEPVGIVEIRRRAHDD